MGNLFTKNVREDSSFKTTYLLKNNLYSTIRYYHMLYYIKLPLLIEDYLGINMRFVLTKLHTTNLYRTHRFFSIHLDFRNLIVEREHHTLFNIFKADGFRVDDIVDFYAGHRIIHTAVIFNDIELVKYLIENDAHLMARDWNGYTPLLKAASLGRLEIIKLLISAGVPPNHMDPWGNTPLDKASLFEQKESFNYLSVLPKDLHKERIEFWKKKAFKEKYKITSKLLYQN